MVLTETRSLAEIRVDSTKVMFFPDYTIAAQKQCNNFLAVKRRLRDLGLMYSLLFPARLCVVAAGTTHFFAMPEEAWHWIEDPSGGPGRSGWFGLPGSSGSRQSQKGLCKRRTSPGVSLTAVPDLEQRIQEQRNAV
ncbi:hypothetical protein NDU88_003099 [Pleurodeles waltl]|uniref:Uncharacterized protein n=1 Tax=Pleurodeles waltl TaxID=8319 RepID=A0AAV7UXH8_PLEWA|nr:hypothetical protein NDU88_003099 [Pleurodeles waltl]